MPSFFFFRVPYMIIYPPFSPPNLLPLSSSDGETEIRRRTE